MDADPRGRPKGGDDEADLDPKQAERFTEEAEEVFGQDEALAELAEDQEPLRDEE